MGAAISCAVAGSTGLVGSRLVELLVSSPRVERVDLLARRAVDTGGSGSKLRAHVVDFERPESFPRLVGTAALFCALGTTLRAAGSAEAFRRVDHDYVLALARWGVAQGIPRFLLVSSVGADARSRALYPRTKGEVEEAVGRLSFRAVHVFRPSFLVGERAESRPGESVGIAAATLLSPLLVGSLSRYRPVPARTVAAALLQAALSGPDGLHVHEGEAIRALAETKDPPA